MKKTSVKVSIGVLTLIEPSIIKVVPDEGASFDVKETYEVRNANLMLNDDKPFCALLSAKKFFYSSDEARKLSATKEFSKDRIALALVMGSLPLRLLGNFFIQFNKPATPTRLFKSENEALIWLRNRRDKELFMKKPKSMLLTTC